ncbi:unnamed protein product, partial [Ascophyllum nodosum]
GEGESENSTGQPSPAHSSSFIFSRDSDLQRLEPARLFGVPADPEALFQRLHD